MKLSKLLYECAKAATNYGDQSFTYLSLMTGEALNDENYANAVPTALTNINGFLQRLSQLRKLPAKIEAFDVSDDDASIPYERFSEKPRSIVAIFQRFGKSYRNLEWRKSNHDVRILEAFDRSKKVYVQYRPEVPYFTMSDIPSCEAVYDEAGDFKAYSFKGAEYANEDGLLEAMGECDFDLEKRLGVPNEAYPLCIEWCKAKMNDLDAGASQALEVKTESRILDIENDENLFLQTEIEACGVLR